MTFYTTTDTDGKFIDENANFVAHDSREAAERHLREVNEHMYDDDDDYEGFEVTNEYEFGDCWIKSQNPPTDDGEYVYSPFTFDELNIQKPGEHPGNHGYWITPSANILIAVPIYKRILS